MSKFESLFEDFQKGLRRFEEVLLLEKTLVTRDSAIKRFEIVFDLSWKLAKTFLEEKRGVRCTSPKECFREAFRERVVDHDSVWLDMSDWRNAAAHTYSEKLADALYAKLPEALKHFQLLEARIRETIQKE